jgi:hypothetical protein
VCRRLLVEISNSFSYIYSFPSCTTFVLLYMFMATCFGQLDQCFSTGSTQRVIWWYARILNYYLFQNLIFTMLIALLKSFSIYLNVKKNIYKVQTKILLYCSNINRNCSLSSNRNSWPNIVIYLNTWNGVSAQRNWGSQNILVIPLALQTAYMSSDDHYWGKTTES